MSIGHSFCIPVFAELAFSLIYSLCLIELIKNDIVTLPKRSGVVGTLSYFRLYRHPVV